MTGKDAVAAGQRLRRPSYCQAASTLVLSLPLGYVGTSAFLTGQRHVTVARRHDSYEAYWRRFMSHPGRPPMR
jgi:hypothetical protein